MVHGFTPIHPLPVKLSLIQASDCNKSYLDLVMQREVVDADLCRHVEKLRDQHLRVDSEVRSAFLDSQSRDVAHFQRKKEAFAKALPTAKVGDYVFEIRESPRPLQAIADGPFQVMHRYKDEAVLRTGTTIWDSTPKEFTRKIDFLTPCLTKRQAIAKAYGQPMEPANREAPLKITPINSLLELSFDS